MSRKVTTRIFGVIHSSFLILNHLLPNDVRPIKAIRKRHYFQNFNDLFRLNY
jgi:hypothetical protein